MTIPLTAEGDLGHATGKISGGLVVSKAQASFTDGKARNAQQAAEHLKALAATAMAGNKVAGVAELGKPFTVTASFGGQSFSIAFSDQADITQPILADGHLKGLSAKLDFGDATVEGIVDAHPVIDVTPKKPVASPPAGMKPGAVSGLTFGPGAGVPSGKEQNVFTVSGKAIADVDSLPAVVLSGGGIVGLNSLEQKRNFLIVMHSWFKSDEATLAHFAEVKSCNIPGGGALHKDAQVRLEAVAAKLGDKMPKSPGVGMQFRTAFNPTMTMSGASMHTLGYAIDYDANQMPRVGRKTMAQLVKSATGRPSNLQLGSYESRRALIKTMGEMSQLPDDDKKKQEFFASKAATELIDKVGTETARLGTTSTMFQQSLGDQRDAFFALRDEMADAKDLAARKAVMAKLPPVIKPWLDSIARAEAELDGRAKAALTPEELAKPLPTDGTLNARQAALQQRQTKIDKALADLKAQGKLELPADSAELPKGLAKDLASWSKDLGTFPGTVGDQLVKLSETAATRRAALGALVGAANEREQLTKLRKDLEDPTFVFGNPRRDKKSGKVETPVVADTPSAAQMVEKGFFNPTSAPTSKSLSFGAQFMQELMKQGFDVGGAWAGESTDSMHMELVVGRPG
ncbi:hypothetical protein [Nocardioides speluncae]|uniref:hypothetical protein n=1 Tax=Nocardioides speluncae TaxID=2670337 RepID=UPI0012B18469|nr:hypothetical protein [Nocardioides speluncae]